MDKPRECGCKGCRTCLICEKLYSINTKNLTLPKDNSYIYCPYCNKAWPGWEYTDFQLHPNHEGTSIEYPGVYIDLNFLTHEEESKLLEGIDQLPWDLSQSGRRKQNYGPKCNFKKNKLKLGEFKGFPLFSKFVQQKFGETPILNGFQTIEQCSLEYDPKRGASIDPHIDDCWIWGERIVTVNLLADSVLTMTYNNKPDRYNLHLVNQYPAVLKSDNTINETNESYKLQPINPQTEYHVVRIPMPRRSLLVLFNSARYDWEHQVLREDVLERRICLAYREFTPPYLERGDKFDDGKKILAEANHFWEL